MIKIPCYFILLAIAVDFLQVKAELQVKFVSILFRHGDRTPKDDGLERYPNDPYLHYEYFPEGPGQLTNMGKKRVFDFGRQIRKRYDTFLGKIYSPFDVLAMSTEYDRTKMSLYVFLAGLFPPSKEQKWNADLDWQPVSVFCIPTKDNFLLLSSFSPQYEREFNMVKNLPEIRNKLDNYSELRKNLTELSGKPILSFNDMYYIYCTFLQETRLGLELPAWTKDYYPDNQLLLNGTTFEYELMSYTEKLRRLNGGPLLRNTTETMVAIAEGTYKKKIHLFSAHEINIAALLINLGIWKPHVPDFASAVIMELLANETNHYVRVFHHLGIPAEIVEKKIPGCSQPCLLKDFIRIVDKALPMEDEIACFRNWKMGDNKYTSCPSSANDIEPVLTGLLCSLVFSVYVMFIKHH